MPKPKLSGPKPYRDFHPGRPNVWGMIQTIAITAIGRGQFVLAIVAAVILAIIIKMPGEQVYLLMDKFVDRYIVGWVLCIFMAVGWIVTAKFLRRTHTGEITRMSSEKTNLQEKLIGKVGSSKESV